MSEKALILKINDKLFAIKQESNPNDLTFQQKCINLLNSYRNCLIQFTNNCKCDENVANISQFINLENQYKSVFNIDNNENVSQKKQTTNSIDVNSKVVENNTNNEFVFGSTTLTEKKNQLIANSIETEFKCSQCQKCYSSREALSQHKRRFHGIPRYQCNQCDKKFTQRTNLNIHLLVHSNDCVKYKCHWDGCDYETKYKNNLKSHELKNHLRKIEKPVECDKCDNSFATARHLTDHRRKVHGISDYECSQCDKKFKCLKDLERHSLVHSVDCEKFKCDWTGCQYETKYKDYLKYHKLNRHLNKGKKFFECHLCGKGFINRYNLQNHVKTIHLGEKLECDWIACDFKTSSASTLKLHRMRHTGDMPFVCEWPACEKKFRTNTRLEKHKKAVHQNDPDFKCDWPECGEAFVRSNYLESHINKVHLNQRPFKCDQCDHAYASSHDLKAHIHQNHTRDKSKCDQCHYETSRPDDLKVHVMRRHTGEKPFKCEWSGCQSSFVTKYELRAHRNSVHNN